MFVDRNQHANLVPVRVAMWLAVRARRPNRRESLPLLKKSKTGSKRRQDAEKKIHVSRAWKGRLIRRHAQVFLMTFEDVA